ncbi:MAG: FG-GAP repeat protein, partial [Myxococcota bacterium]
GSLGVDVGPAGNFSDAADEGIDDIVLGSTTAGGGAGAAFVVLGRETWPATITMSSDDATNAGNNVIRLVGAANGDEFGYQVLGVPDVGTPGGDTADGFNELAVGSQLANGDRGRVSIFYGGPLANFAAAPVAGVDDVAIETFDPQGANFGGELAVGDVTGDGTPDLIVGAYGSDGVGIFDFDSGIPTTVTEYWTRPGSGAFGESLALSDVDSDGDLDLLAGGISRDELAIFFNVSGSFEPNPMTLGNPADIALTETSDWGRYVDPIGDINNDGLEDFIVSRAGASQVVIFY